MAPGVGLDSMPPLDVHTCCLCGQPDDPDVPASLGALLCTQAGPASQRLHYHEACAGYSSGIAHGRRVGSGRGARREPFRHGEIPGAMVWAEVDRASRGKQFCAACDEPGATVNCLAATDCEHHWHLPCARAAAQRDGSVVFSASVMGCACRKHASR